MVVRYSKFINKKTKLGSGMEIGWVSLGHIFSGGHVICRATLGTCCYYIYHVDYIYTKL